LIGRVKNKGDGGEEGYGGEVVYGGGKGYERFD